MANSNRVMTNYVDLIRLKAEKFLQNGKFGIMLNDDIWEDGTLLVKSGKYLTDSLLSKLINFGVKKVNVNFVEKEAEMILLEQEAVKNFEPEYVSNNFVKTQNVLIIENNLINASWIVRSLIDIGFSEGNIFVTANYNSINKYFKVKKINFMFIGLSLYEKCSKSFNKYSLLKNTHSFALIEKGDTVRKIKNNYACDVKFLMKPLGYKYFKTLISKAINENMHDVYLDEVEIS